MTAVRPIEARLHPKVDTSGGLFACWPFIGARDPGGYGQIKFEGRTVGAHRLMLSLHLGRAIAAGEVVRHTCDNPPCVNPAHLLTGSQGDNVVDMYARGRHITKRERCGRGLHPMSGDNVFRNGPGRACRACRDARVSQRRRR